MNVGHAGFSSVVKALAALLIATAKGSALTWLNHDCSLDDAASMVQLGKTYSYQRPPFPFDDSPRQVRRELPAPLSQESVQTRYAQRTLAFPTASDLPDRVAKGAEELTAAVADLPQASAAEMLMNPGMSKDSLASALLQSETAHLAERQLALEALGELKRKSDQAAQLESRVRQLKSALAASKAGQTQATANTSHTKSRRSADLGLNTTENVTSNPAAAMDAVFTRISRKIDALLGKIPGWKSLDPEFKVLIAVILVNSVIGCLVGIMSTAGRSNVIICLLFVNPFVFLVGALFFVRHFGDLVQNFAYLGLVMCCMFLQCMLSAEPISIGLVDACCELPQVVANAFLGLQKQMADQITALVADLIPGDDPLESLVELTAQLFTAIFAPAIQTVASLMDVRKFLPAAFFSVAILAPLLGLVLFALFVSTWGVLANFLMLKMGAVTMLVFWLMMALAGLALTGDRIVHMFIYTVQGILNFVFKTFMMEIVPTDALDPICSKLGTSSSATDIKRKIVDALQLDLKLDGEDDEDEDPNKDSIQENLNDVFCGCFKSKDAPAAPEQSEQS